MYCVVLALLPTSLPAESIDQRIESQRDAIASTEDEREAAREALAEQRKRLKFLEEKAAELDAERARLEQRRRQLAAQEARLREGPVQRPAGVAPRLRAAYPLTRGSALQTLLGDGDALQAQRELHYLRGLIRLVQEARRALEAQRAELADHREAIAGNERALAQASERLDAHHHDVQRNLDEQQRLLARLGETLDGQQRSLKAMLEKKRRLDREVAAARAASERQARKTGAEPQTRPAGSATASPSIAAKGIPVTGPVQRRFGESLPQGGLRNEGVEFGTAAGTPVRAVADGEVAYAGPLKGWGNLVMLRHRGDYLSLYAHCRSLVVSKGESITRGQTLCHSGVIDANREGLYVEVRRGNRPIDPTRWAAWKRATGG